MAWSDLTAATLDATTAALGESVTYTPAGGAAETVTGIYDAASEVVQLQGGVEVIGTAPMVSFDISDLSQVPAAGDAVTAGGVSYTIERVEIDGGGGCSCFLNR